MIAHRAEFSIAAMCRVLRVSSGGYYAWLQRPKQSRWQQADAKLLATIRAIFVASRQLYGARRIQAVLRARGIRAGRPRIARLMAAAGLRPVSSRRPKGCTRSAPAVFSQDLVQRQFQATRPNELWVADATYVPTRQGVLYVAVIMDVFARRVVGWSMAAHQRTELMVNALQMAVVQRQPTAVIHHSDHGSQYTSRHYRDFCRRANIKISMGSVGDCYDNAMMESFFATLEKELINVQPQRRFKDRAQAQSMIFDYVEGFYNPRRLHSALEYLSPVAYEARYFSTAERHGSS